MAASPIPSPPARPIVIRRVKKVSGGGHHGGAWKVAYADFVTAMMAFFMLLWLLSSPDKDKLKGLAQYFSPSSAAGKPGEQLDAAANTAQLGGQQQRVAPPAASRNAAADPASGSRGSSRGGQARIADPRLQVIAEELKLLLQPATVPRAEQQNTQMSLAREGLRVSLMDDANRSMFRPGTAVLNPYARTMLLKVAGKIAATRLQVAVEGHTDGTGGQSDANWRLSGARALEARRTLIEGGLPPDQMTEVVALAATRLVYPDQPDRPENRRITIVLLAEAPNVPSDVSFRF